MANTFGQSKANDTSAWQNNKEMNPQENSSVTDDVFDENDEPGEDSWRPTDAPVESPTDEAFDDAEAKKRNKNIHSETPGLNPDIAE
jgi:hypothetical protein